jgi:hypothetical protein
MMDGLLLFSSYRYYGYYTEPRHCAVPLLLFFIIYYLRHTVTKNNGINGDEEKRMVCSCIPIIINPILKII